MPGADAQTLARQCSLHGMDHVGRRLLCTNFAKAEWSETVLLPLLAPAISCHVCLLVRASLPVQAIKPQLGQAGGQ